jgi:hypothetical protein
MGLAGKLALYGLGVVLVAAGLAATFGGFSPWLAAQLLTYGSGAILLAALEERLEGSQSLSPTQGIKFTFGRLVRRDGQKADVEYGAAAAPPTLSDLLK